MENTISKIIAMPKVIKANIAFCVTQKISPITAITNTSTIAIFLYRGSLVKGIRFFISQFVKLILS